MAAPAATKRLADMQRSAQQSSASLVALELDSGRKLLASATLEGASAQRWHRASTSLTELWRRQGLLEGLLARAEELGGRRRSEEIAALLDGCSIDLGPDAGEPSARSLLPAQGQLCSPAELLAGMSVMFDEVKGVTELFAQTWETLIPQLESVRRMAHRTSALADEISAKERERLEPALDAVASLAHEVARDPLSVKPDVIATLTAEFERLRRGLERSAELRGSFPSALLDARAQLAALGRAHAEARAARQELLVKITRPDAPGLPEPDETLHVELDRISGLAEHGAWQEARHSLDALSGRIDAAIEAERVAIDACRAPIVARNRFRALLEAYQVKARQLGLIEDPHAAAIFREAEAELYNAPTDLVNASQLVRRYQETLSDPPTREVKP